jgi:hypothetical protein
VECRKGSKSVDIGLKVSDAVSGVEQLEEGVGAVARAVGVIARASSKRFLVFSSKNNLCDLSLL